MDWEDVTVWWKQCGLRVDQSKWENPLKVNVRWYSNGYLALLDNHSRNPSLGIFPGESGG